MHNLAHLFLSDDFMPHGFCYMWKPGLVWLHAVSDLSIGIAYTSIPFTLAYFVRRRRDLPFHWMFVCFGVFIIACGATHYMEVWNLWHAEYWLAGIVKAITAIASVGTAVLLVRLMPVVLAIPSPADLQAKSKDLAREIFERRLAETEAKISERRLAGILDLAEDAVISVDEGQTIRLFNQGAEKTFGYSADEAIGKSLDTLIPERFIKEHRQHVQGFIEGSMSARRMGERKEIYGLRKDGNEFPAEGSISKLVQDGNVVLTVMLRDVSDRKAAEREIRERSAQLELANKELEAFAYSVSHDLRAPLRSIDGFSSALAEDCEKQLDEVGLQYLTRIRRATNQMGLLIDDLLRLSRITRAEVRRELVDVRPIAQNIAAELAKRDSKREVRFEIQDGLTVFADSHLLFIVFQNLIENAWKFTSKHKSARIAIGMEQHDGKTALFVSDDGAGFDPAYAGKLFSAFQRLHAVTDFPGTGVGLATVQRIIQKHGGRIWAEAQIEKGATFRFTLD